MKSSRLSRNCADVGRAHKMLEPQIANAPAQEHPKIFFVEHPKTGAAALQQPVAPGMKGASLQAVKVALPFSSLRTRASISAAELSV